MWMCSTKGPWIRLPFLQRASVRLTGGELAVGTQDGSPVYCACYTGSSPQEGRSCLSQGTPFILLAATTRTFFDTGSLMGTLQPFVIWVHRTSHKPLCPCFCHQRHVPLIPNHPESSNAYISTRSCSAETCLAQCLEGQKPATLNNARTSSCVLLKTTEELIS